MGVHKLIKNRLRESIPQYVAPFYHPDPVMYAALEAEAKKEHKKELAKWRRKAKRVEETLKRVSEKDLKLIMEYL